MSQLGTLSSIENEGGGHLQLIELREISKLLSRISKIFCRDNLTKRY